MRWTWMLRRWAISVFLIGHLTALTVWNMPACAVRYRLFEPISYYMLPTGLWQYWGMFAPEPIKETLTVEAVMRDAKGRIHRYEFPKIVDFSFWSRIPRVRHSKFTCNFAQKELPVHREFSARHAVRQLKLSAEDFPVYLDLNFQLWPSPPPGMPPIDAMTPPTPHYIQSYRFLTLEDVQP